MFLQNITKLSQLLQQNSDLFAMKDPVLFACVALRVASSVLCGLGLNRA